MAHIPVMPNDEDAHTHHHVWLHKLMAGIEPLLIGGAGVSIAITEDGKYKISIKPGGQSGPSGPISIRGEYDPTATYAVNDIVVISTGLNQGTFVCLAAGTTGISPTVGAPNWLQLPGGVLGMWI